MHANGGPGDLVKPSVELSAVERGFVMMSCISSTAGAYTGGSVRVLLKSIPLSIKIQPNHALGQ
jgi:hypothetical protein